MLGEDVPNHPLCLYYKQQAGNSRVCVGCGKRHDMIVKDTRTGERLEELDKCKDCLFKPKREMVMKRYKGKPREVIYL